MATEAGGSLSIAPCLLLVAGPSVAAEALPFSRQSGERMLVSCSALLLTVAPGAGPSGGTQHAYALVPAAVFRPWAHFPSVAQLPDDCTATVLLPPSREGLPGRYLALECAPCLPVPVRPAAHALQDLQRSVSRASGDWRFAWAVGSLSLPPEDQASLVLCRVAPPLLEEVDGDQSGRGGAADVGEEGEDEQLRQLYAVLLNSAAGAATCSPCGNSQAAAAAACLPAGELSCGLLPGAPVSIVGSPFGCLAPHHFLNAHVRGVVALAFPLSRSDILPPDDPAACECSVCGSGVGVGSGCSACSHAHQAQQHSPVLALDVHVFPGMEGALVLHGGDAPQQHQHQPQGLLAGVAPCCWHEADADPHRAQPAGACCCSASCAEAGGGSSSSPVVGVLIAPLTRQADGVQLPLMLAWPAVRAALLAELLRHCSSRRGHPLPPQHNAGPAGIAAQQLQLQPLAGMAAPAELVLMRGGAVQSAGHAGLPLPRQMRLQPPAACLGAVVLLRSGTSWATGLLVAGPHGGSGSGAIILTVAHLLARRDAPTQPQQQQQQLPHLPQEVCDVRLPSPPGPHPLRGGGSRDPWVGPAAPRGGAACSSGTAQPPAYAWARARVLHCFTNHLDLAVLEVVAEDEAPAFSAAGSVAASSSAAAAAAAAALEWPQPHFQRQQQQHQHQQQQQHMASNSRAAGGRPRVPPTSQATGGGPLLTMAGVSEDAALEGLPVWAVGHSLMGPAVGWPAGVTHGTLAKVVRTPGSSGRPTMAIATAATHAGGSGGALMDCHGRLVGLVTSNARHAGRTTLSNLAFCIAAAELQPVMCWARARALCHHHDGDEPYATHHPPLPRVLPPLPHHHHAEAAAAGRAQLAAAACGSAAGACGPAAASQAGQGFSLLGALPQPLPQPRLRFQGTVEELRGLDVEDVAASRVWRLQAPEDELLLLEPRAGAGKHHRHQRHQQQQQQKGKGNKGKAPAAAAQGHGQRSKL